MASINWLKCAEAGCPCRKTPDWDGSYRAWTVETLANAALVHTAMSATAPGSVAPSHAEQRELERAIVAILESERRNFDVRACPWQIARETFRRDREELESASDGPQRPLVVELPVMRRSPPTRRGPRRSAPTGPWPHRGAR